MARILVHSSSCVIFLSFCLLGSRGCQRIPADPVDNGEISTSFFLYNNLTRLSELELFKKINYLDIVQEIKLFTMYQDVIDARIK